MIWQAANNGSSKRHWFVFRQERVGTPMEIAEDARGNYRRFASYKAAQRLADSLNRAAA